MERVAETSKNEPSFAAAGHGRVASPFSTSLPPALELQQLVGNQAMQQLLRSGYIQAKLAISNPDDPEEREADEVAHTIMRAHAAAPAVPCSCGSGEEMCEECQQQSSAAIQRHASAPDPPPRVPQIVRNVLGSSGRLLDAATRSFFEPRFGHDFSHVRIHTGPEAAASARSISANAYTAGSDIVFASGQYSPETTTGRTLLAHELTHTVQQSGMSSQTDHFPSGSATDAFKTEARATAESEVLQRQPRFEVSRSTVARIQRQPAGSTVPSDKPATAQAKDEQEVIEADVISDEDYFALTGIPPDILPQGVLINDLREWAEPIVNAPADTLPPGIGSPGADSSNHASQVTGVGPATVPNPMSYVPENATGILWTPGHLSIFAKTKGETTIRGFRANLATHAMAEFSFKYAKKLSEGVPGSFKNDMFYTRWGSQLVIYVPTDSETAAGFKDELDHAEYDLQYRYSVPKPDAKEGSTEQRLYEYLKERLGDASVVECSFNCITAPASQIEGAIGMLPELDTAAGKLNIVTGKTNGAKADPTEAGRAKRMEAFMRDPDLSGARPGATKVGITKTAGKTMGVVRLAGKIWLVYGATASLKRIWDADLSQLPQVLLEEGASWGGGLGGAELAGVISTGIGETVFVASGTEISTLFVVGSTGLSLGLAYVGARAGEWAIDAVENIYEFVTNLPEEIRAFANVVAMGLNAVQETGKFANQILVHIFLRPVVVLHESINPANWDLRRMPPGAVNAVYSFGISAWRKLGSLEINDFKAESLKSCGELGVDQASAIAVSHALALSGLSVAPEKLLAATPGDFVNFLKQGNSLRFIQDPEAIADNMLTDQGHQIDEQQANVRTAPVIGRRASINPNNWDLRGAGAGKPVISDLGFQIWERLRTLDLADFDSESEKSLATLGVSREMAIAAADVIYRPLSPDFKPVENESTPEETLTEGADGTLQGTPMDLVNTMIAWHLLKFVQEPSTIAQRSVQWLRAGYQPW